MKYTIEGFSQEAALKLTVEKDGKTLKLDITDLTILRVFADFYNTGMKKIKVDDVEYGWVNYSYFLKQLPLLDIQYRAFYNRLQKMVILGVLKHHTAKNEDNTKSAYYTFGEKYKSLLPYSYEYDETPVENTQGGMYSNTEGYVSEYIGGMYSNTQGGMYSNTHNSSINIDSSIKDKKTTTKAAKPNGDKSISDQKKGFEKIISDYTQNEKLKETLFDFIKMRKTKKKAMTDRALQILLSRLDKLFKNDDDKIISLEKSITHCWDTVYELKPEEAAQAEQQQDEMEQYWKQFEIV